MTSYLRYIFGGQAASTPAPPIATTTKTSSKTTSTKTKTHHRSRSDTTPTKSKNLAYIYAPPGTASSTATSSSRERSNSYTAARANAPSPLRYTYDSSSVRARSVQDHQPPPPPPRVPIYRAASHKNGSDRPTPYPLYTPTTSFSSAHSTSSSSVQHGSSVSGHRRPPMPPRTSSSGSVAHSEHKPALKQTSTWNGEFGHKAASAPRAHVSFLNPHRPITLHMHPLLAHSRLHRAPISYDVTYTPSSRTVLDRSTMCAIPNHTLSQPATDPPTMGRLVVKSEKFPWEVVACSSGPTSRSASGSGGGTSSSSSGKSKFYVGSSSSSRSKRDLTAGGDEPVTNLDLLYALHNTLSTRVTQAEWEALGHGSRAQRKVSRAYEKRCLKMGGGWDGGVRRVDWLGGKTRLVGVEVDRGAGKLVFGKG